MDQTAVTEQHPEAKEAIQRFEELRSISNRVDWERDAEDIARLIRPQRGGFGLSDPSTRRQEKPLNSEPILAQSSFAAGIYAGITNPATRWVGFETGDEDLNAWQPMAEWNDTVTKRVLASFSPSTSPFYSATFQAYSDIAAFGNAAGYDEVQSDKRRILDATVSLADVVVGVDGHGRVNEIVRRFRLTARDALLEYKGHALPAKVLEMAERGSKDKIVFYQHVKPNETFERGKLGTRGKPWASVHACEIKSSLVGRSGYEEMPFYLPRWDVDTGHVMGTGPGFIALASTRSVDLMTKATLRAAQMAADPSLLAPDRDAWALQGRVRPGQVIYGGVNPRGERLIHPLQTIGDIGLTDQHKEKTLEAVKDAFHYAILSLSGRTGVTDEETRIMEEARLRNWAPHADRIMEEYAAPKAERRFRMLWRAGQLPPPPPEAQGVPMRLRYQSAASAALMAREGLAIRQFVADMTPLAQLDPRYMDRMDPDALTEAMHDAAPSLPAKILRSREEADAIAEARAQQQQAEQAMLAAETAGGVAKDMGQAAAAMGRMQ